MPKFYYTFVIKKQRRRFNSPSLWSRLGLNQGPPDYESGATNQLSYGTGPFILSFHNMLLLSSSK